MWTACRIQNFARMYRFLEYGHDKGTNKKMKDILILGLFLAFVLPAVAADAPPAEAFQVLPAVATEAPEITPYLQYQVEMAWQQDDQRRKDWEQIRSEQDVERLQRKLEEHLLA